MTMYKIVKTLHNIFSVIMQLWISPNAATRVQSSVFRLDFDRLTTSHNSIILEL